MAWWKEASDKINNSPPPWAIMGGLGAALNTAPLAQFGALGAAATNMNEDQDMDTIQSPFNANEYLKSMFAPPPDPTRHPTNKVSQGVLDNLQPARAQYDRDIRDLESLQYPGGEGMPDLPQQDISQLMKSSEVQNAVQAMLNSMNTPIKEQINQVRSGLKEDLRTLAWLDKTHSKNLKTLAGEQQVRGEAQGKKLKKEQAAARQSYNTDMTAALDPDVGMLDEGALADIQAQQKSGAADMRVQQDELAQFESEREASGLDYMNQILAASQMNSREDMSRVQRDAGEDVDTLRAQILANNQQAPALQTDLAMQLQGQSQQDYANRMAQWSAQQEQEQAKAAWLQAQLQNRIAGYTNQMTYGSRYPSQFDVEKKHLELQPQDPLAMLPLFEFLYKKQKIKSVDPETGQPMEGLAPVYSPEDISGLLQEMGLA
jgi:hypothetical protein